MKTQLLVARIREDELKQETQRHEEEEVLLRLENAEQVFVFIFMAVLVS